MSSALLPSFIDRTPGMLSEQLVGAGTRRADIRTVSRAKVRRS